MQFKVYMKPLKRDDNVVAVGILYMGEIRIRNLSLMRNKSGEMFLVMPGKDSGKVDANGKRIYERILIQKI